MKRLNPTTLEQSHTSSPQARGKRLKLIRKMTGLARNQLEEKYDISANTLQSWEVAKKGGLTLRGARRILSAVEQEGICCSLDWLLHGIGNSPQAITPLPSYDLALPAHNLSEQERINKELDMFYALHAGTMHFVVKDNSMEPYYHFGDYVAGVAHILDTINTLVGKDCIVQTSDYKIHFRHIKRGAQPGLYDLVYLNPASDASVALNQRIMKAAPIIWQRKRDAY